MNSRLLLNRRRDEVNVIQPKSTPPVVDPRVLKLARWGILEGKRVGAGVFIGECRKVRLRRGPITR